jgi:hypothetical protein
MQVIFMHHICYMWIHIYVDNIFILRLMHFVNRILNKKKQIGLNFGLSSNE